jgi:glycosyltransferase involved in cell wall biosynthesis
MRIAQIAPLYESVPPQLYGGTERIVSYLTECLVHEGHQVTLFATGDSRTRARLLAGAARPLRLARTFDPLAYHVAQLRHVMDRASEFDVIHNHMDYLGFTLAVGSRIPVVTTLHGRLDLPDLPALFATYSDVDLISISDAQRAPLPAAQWRGTVHHGLPADLYRPGNGEGGYLAFLGRISPEKRLDSAIRVARRVGVPLRVAAKVDNADVRYFETEIQPLLREPEVEFIGELGESDKQRFLGDARALLFPIDWPEPFGLVMIEALACGTPVIARRRGSVPEVIAHGVTGFVCDDEDAMAEAVRRLDTVDRGTCRRAFEARFTAARMTRDYVRLYEALLTESARGAA